MGWILSLLGDVGPAAAVCDYPQCGRVSTHSYLQRPHAVMHGGCYIASTSNKIYCPDCKEALGKGHGTDDQKSKWTFSWWISEKDVSDLPVCGSEQYWAVEGKGKMQRKGLALEHGGNVKGAGKVWEDGGKGKGKGKDGNGKAPPPGLSAQGSSGSQYKIYDDQDCVEEIQKMQGQLTTLGAVAADTSSELSSRFDVIEKNMGLIKESLELVLSNQLYLATKMKRSGAIAKSFGDSDCFDGVSGVTIVDHIVESPR